MYNSFELYMSNSIFFSSYTCITPLFSSYTCITPFFFELYMYNSIFFELYMYNSIFLSDTFRYISIHSIFSCFSTFLSVNVCIFHHSMDEFWTAFFFRYRFSEIKTVILENQPTAYLPFLFFFLLPLWPIWNFFPSLPCWSSFLAWSSILFIGFKIL